MEFYTSIAKVYDHIFPFKPVQKSFVQSFLQDTKEGSFMDVGCGTGGLVLSLTEDFKTLVGIDPDSEMLSIARKARKEKTLTQTEEDLKFMPLGMLDLEVNFCPNTLDVIACFGNTVVHLDSEDEVQSFLYQARFVLKPKGKLLIQIINYDRIIDQKLSGLPTIENEEVRFERIYKYEENPQKIDFITKLTIKETGQIIENSVPLLALRPERLKHLTLEAGFTNITEYGNFKKEAFTPTSQPYIISAE